MKPLPRGVRFSFSITTQYRDTAEAFGNPGVRVIGTPALIGFLETAADRCIAAYYEADEGSVGTSINVQHLAAAPEGCTIVAQALVIEVTDNRKVRFGIEAKSGDTVLMKGQHERAVINLRRFLERHQPFGAST